MPVKVVSQSPMHIHPHLDIYYQGQPVEVPAEVGIADEMYATHKYDKYIGDMGAAPLHTHDTTGTIHVESSVTAKWTLGNFLEIWGVNLKGHHVKLYVDGDKVRGYKGHQLQDGENLVLDIDPEG